MIEYPKRLYHNTPGWARETGLFHIRIRMARECPRPLTSPDLAERLLEGAKVYHAKSIWWCHMILLMPDHLHAMLAFPPQRGMAACLSNWKRYAARFYGVRWQENFFDHRIRSLQESEEKWSYIRRNPVARGLVKHEDEWPWWWSGAL